MHHEHHPGCGHHEDDHAHHVHHMIGQMCCQGKCSHLEHQAAWLAESLRQSVNTNDYIGNLEKSKKKKRRSPSGFTLTSLLVTT